ncbi:MAG: hypothetical protein ACTFAL_16045 [Candidatus Electronema sp. V4]|uniref:hypothetical protein n=1 Tax=Candidatus Electronema sp. V4 TaxID=3454756 RepID=UPI0040556AAF
MPVITKLPPHSMSAKRILTIAFELASPDTTYQRFNEKISLLDWDIVLFRPQIEDFIDYDKHYQGKPRLSESSSFRLKESCEHWRREIKQAVDAGKIVIVFLSPLEEVYIDTGERRYSGAGRNQKTTFLVGEYNNYKAIPADLAPTNTSGKAMRLATHGADVLAPYWAEFESVSEYKVILNDLKVPPCLVTRTGDKAVGALFSSKSSSGTLVLLPYIDFEPPEFFQDDINCEFGTPAAEQFASRMVAAVVALDKALRSAGEITPAPQWTEQPQYALGTEPALCVELLHAEQAVEEAQRRKEEIMTKLANAGAYRRLLFEKGKPLENVIIDTLRLFGFQAEQYEDSNSQFDAVFESEEGRFIGEAEGKDSEAVNIKKLRQLSMNIDEDLQRENVTVPAKPVLFGNGYRLLPLSEREDPFTKKCHSAAATSSTALVFTPDLFPPAQYLLSNPDDEYAKACRLALLSATGRVTFPAPPAADEPQAEMDVAEVSGVQ